MVAVVVVVVARCQSDRINCPSNGQALGTVYRQDQDEVGT
jgi:hypothetical protein